jgi:hypothetical protein
MSGITVERDTGMALSVVTVWSNGDLLRKNFVVESEAEEFARKLHAAKLLDHFFASLCKTYWQQATNHQYSDCRGYIQPHWNLQHDEPAKKLVAAFDAYFGAISEHGCNDAKLTTSGAYKALDTAFSAYKNAIRSGSEWEETSPPDQGGKEAAPTEQRICTGVPEGERVLGNSHRVERVPGVSAEKVNTTPTRGNGSRVANPLHKEWEELNKAVKSGEAVMIPTPEIPRNGGLRVIEHPLTEHEPVNPAAIKYQVMDLLEGPIPSYRYRDVAQHFRIKEGLTGSCLIFFHKERPGTFVVIGYWTLTTNGRHRWNLNKDWHKRLEELYSRLNIPIIERVKEVIPY